MRTDRVRKEKASVPKMSIIETTLYDLIEAIREAIGPEEDNLIAPTVMSLIDTGKLKFINAPQISLLCAFDPMEHHKRR